MKKIILISFLIISLECLSQNSSDKKYQYLEIGNEYVANIVDFKLTYDNYTGDDNCYNNIQIFAHDMKINIYFWIYLDDELVYEGWAKLPANTNYYLDDAFKDCNSSRKNCYIKIKAREE